MRAATVGYVVQEEDMVIFRATVMGAMGRPTLEHFQQLSKQLQGELPDKHAALRSAERVQERFEMLNACFQQHRSRQN